MMSGVAPPRSAPCSDRSPMCSPSSTRLSRTFTRKKAGQQIIRDVVGASGARTIASALTMCSTPKKGRLSGGPIVVMRHVLPEDRLADLATTEVGEHHRAGRIGQRAHDVQCRTGTVGLLQGLV